MSTITDDFADTLQAAYARGCRDGVESQARLLDKAAAREQERIDDLVEQLEEQAQLIEEREQIIDQLRRHGGDWIVEGATKMLDYGRAVDVPDKSVPIYPDETPPYDDDFHCPHYPPGRCPRHGKHGEDPCPVCFEKAKACEGTINVRQDYKGPWYNTKVEE